MYFKHLSIGDPYLPASVQYPTKRICQKTAPQHTVGSGLLNSIDTLTGIPFWSGDDVAVYKVAA